MFKCLKILKISIASLINDKEANRAVVFEITKGKGTKGMKANPVVIGVCNFCEKVPCFF